MNRFYKTVVGSSFVICLGAWSSWSQPARAVRLADGSIAFNHPPRLLGASTTEKSIRALGAKYYFTISVPANAGEPLQRVAIAQREGADAVRFSLQKTQAFEDRSRKQELALSAARVDENQAVSVVFNPPIPPGKTVTIRLRPRHNPGVSGVYLFGVTAFPPGEKVRSQFLGFGRLHFYSSFDGSLLSPWRSSLQRRYFRFWP